MKKFILLFSFSLFAFSALHAGGIKGLIKDRAGDTLAFVTLYVKEVGTGTTSNENGLYELNLAQGDYTVVFQLMGYKTQTHTIVVGKEFTELNIRMEMQSNMLQEVSVVAGKEDPAYSIMRKAIAKAQYHRQQLNAYSARVYIKGTGRLKDYPWFMKNEMKKEGIEKNRVFISESVSEISYKRPNTYKEKVIAVHSSGKDNNTSPNGYVFRSFYSPNVSDNISPLSPYAFSYYKFKYLGAVQDRNYTVYKIQVTPRAKGENVFEGVLLIVADAWSIHSLDLSNKKMGILYRVKQIYAPIEDKIWEPISHNLDLTGNFLGFDFEYHYLATVNNYKIELNKDLYAPQLNLIDEKVNKQTEEEAKQGADTKQLQKRLEEGKPITGKELRKAIKEYERKEAKAAGKKDIWADYTYAKDSMQFRVDTTFWDSLRPIPLTPLEVIGYRKTDSVAIVKQRKASEDSVKHKSHKGFKPWDVIIGNSYKVAKHSSFVIKTPGVGFNTVEGLNFFYRLRFSSTFSDTNKTNFSISPVGRYGFASKQLYGKALIRLKNKNYDFSMEGGKYVQQFNKEEPVYPIQNSLSTLLYERNFMKVYQNEFAALKYENKSIQKVTGHLSVEWANRRALQNNSNYKLVDWKDVIDYSPNNPINYEYGSEVTNINSQALKAHISLSAKPWQKYWFRNSEKLEIENSSPTIAFSYTKGIPAFTSNVNYDVIETSFSQTSRKAIRGRLSVKINAGIFLNKKSLYFMDYKHFSGNRLFVYAGEPSQSFRMLDYYMYSTKDKYVSGNIYYQFRRLLLSNIFYVRLLGIREALFINYLTTPTLKNYTEVGYSIDGILKIFRLEAATSFQNGTYLNYGFRIGISTKIGASLSDY